MFPLKQRKFIRGCAEHIAAGLGCGTDYQASIGTELFAPFDGKITREYKGTEGGNWLWFDDGKGNSLQFAHLSAYVKGVGSVKQGEVIAKTGNTGQITTGPHLHVQILDSTGKRLDPEKYKWDSNDMDKTAFVKYIYRATQGREPSASELSFALGLSEEELVKLRFRDDVIGGYWKSSAGTDCPESEKGFWQNEIIVNPAHDIVFLQKQWHTDHAAQPTPLTPQQKKQITKDYVASL